MTVSLPRATAMVLDSWKVVYVITPKLMGTSMLWMMAGLQNEDPARYVTQCRAPEVSRSLAVHDPAIWQQWFTPLHLLPADVIERVAGDDGWFRLAWTRHPVDRLWSAWQSKLLLREPLFVELYGAAPWFPRTPPGLAGGPAALSAIAEDFESFVAALDRDPQLLITDPHWAPQSDLLRPDVFPYSEIGRIESAAVTLGRLQHHLQDQGWQGTLDLKRLNATLLPRTTLRNPALLRRIEDIYADDMIAFGYQPANVGPPPSPDAGIVAVQALAELVERHERISDLHRMIAPDYYPGAPGGSPKSEEPQVRDPTEEARRPDEQSRDRHSTVEISDVVLLLDSDRITAACLDNPRTGSVDGCVFEVLGWVVSASPVVEVEFLHEGAVIERCGLTVSRPDVASVYGSSSPVGFWKPIGTVGLEPDFAIVVRVVFDDGSRDVIAEIRGTQRLSSAFIASIQPITVTSVGRSGSALLMKMLQRHPDIVLEDRFPYETRVLSYWMHFIQVLAAPADALQAESHRSASNRLTPFPYFFKGPTTGLTPPEQTSLDRWYGTDQVEELARVAQNAVESFYLEYAGARHRPTPAFFAEKIAPDGRIRTVVRQLYPGGREIFLVRDPRDILASVLAFNAKRGFSDFGRERVDTDEQYVGVLREKTVALTRQWRRRSRHATLVRYEDLVHSPADQIRAILDALELDSSAIIVDAMVDAGNEAAAEVEAHRTSPGGPSSIGRWKQGLEPRLQQICDEAFDGLFDEFSGSSG